MDLILNDYQTELHEGLRKEYHKDVISDLYDYINSVPLIKHLIGVDRGVAKRLTSNDI